MSGQEPTAAKKLTAKQQCFVAEYLVDMNATQAAIRAGYSAKTAGAIGDEVLKKPEIAEAIKSAMDARSERTEITQDMVLRELAKIGFSDLRKMFSNGNLIAIDALDDESAACLSSIEVVTRRVPGGEESEVEHVAKIKVWDKQAALVNIGRHLGMFTDKVDMNVKGDIAELLAASRARAASING